MFIKGKGRADSRENDQSASRLLLLGTNFPNLWLVQFFLILGKFLVFSWCISEFLLLLVTGVSPGLVHYWRNALNRKKLFGVPKSQSVRYKTSLFCIIYMD